MALKYLFTPFMHLCSICVYCIIHVSVWEYQYKNNNDLLCIGLNVCELTECSPPRCTRCSLCLKIFSAFVSLETSDVGVTGLPNSLMHDSSVCVDLSNCTMVYAAACCCICCCNCIWWAIFHDGRIYSASNEAVRRIHDDTDEFSNGFGLPIFQIKWQTKKKINFFVAVANENVVTPRENETKAERKTKSQQKKLKKKKTKDFTLKIICSSRTAMATAIMFRWN